jgi:hypothetical protein
MRQFLNFIGIGLVLLIASCEKRNEFTTPTLIPIDHYDIQLVSAVEDGVWLRKQKFVYKNSTLSHSYPCVFPLPQEPLKLYKYDLSGQLTDSIADPAAILFDKFYGN